MPGKHVSENVVSPVGFGGSWGCTCWLAICSSEVSPPLVAGHVVDGSKVSGVSIEVAKKESWHELMCIHFVTGSLEAWFDLAAVFLFLAALAQR